MAMYCHQLFVMHVVAYVHVHAHALNVPFAHREFQVKTDTHVHAQYSIGHTPNPINMDMISTTFPYLHNFNNLSPSKQLLNGLGGIVGWHKLPTIALSVGGLKLTQRHAKLWGWMIYK